MAKWILVDAWEMGYEYECSACKRHVSVWHKGKDLPDECPYCKTQMEREEESGHG